MRVQLNSFRSGPTVAVEFLAWLGLNLDPSLPISKDSIGGIRNPPEAARWFSDATYLPKDAVVIAIDDAPGLKFVLDNLEITLDAIDIGAIETTLGYVFVEKTFLIQAITHGSYLSSRLTLSLERLEVKFQALLPFFIIGTSWGLHCTEVAFALLTQQPLVRIKSF